MKRISFVNDYSEGADEHILEALSRTNREQTPGYGEDAYCERAREAIRSACHAPDAAVHFLSGGTQVNLTVVAAALRPHQGVVAAQTAHVAVHESGAIEATGHKVLTISTTDGKLRAADVERVFSAHYADATFEHTVQPGMVYISHPSELGTLYTKAELSALRAVCDRYHAPLYLDGARLGCALSAAGTDVTLSDLAQLTDAFYIGGTKLGALFGEALVLLSPALARDFRYIQKQHGGMAAKGRILGIQFLTLFTDGLYESLGAHANRLAARLTEGITRKGYCFVVPTETNQVFPIFPKTVLSQLSGRFDVGFWAKVDETSDAVRLCTSWATTEDAVDAFLSALPDASA